MSNYVGPAPTPPRTTDLWKEVVARLDVVGLEALTKPDQYTDGMSDGAGGFRDVVMAHEVLPVGDGDVQWARLVVVPVTTAFPLADGPGRDRAVPFLIRSDANRPDRFADPFPALELLQLHAFARLHGWKPDPADLDYATMRFRCWREESPQAQPIYDPEMGLHYLSAEYRVVLESPDVT